MAGVIVELFSRRTFDFSSLAAAGVARIAWDAAQPVEEFTEGVIVLRSHAHTIPAAASFRVRAFLAAPSREQPSTTFWATTPAIGDALLTSAGPSAPTLIVAPLATNFGGFLYVDVTATQGSGMTTLSATLSCDLVVKRRAWGR